MKVAAQERAIFKLFSLGVSTNRDEWLYAFERPLLESKVRFFVDEYERVRAAGSEFPDTTKWSRNLKRRLQQGRKEAFHRHNIIKANYRPFVQRWLYQSELYLDESGALAEMFPPGAQNMAICFSGIGSRTDYCVLAIDHVADLHFGAAVDGYQQVPRFRFNGAERVDNITDWALDQFRHEYENGGKRHRRPITKDAIFHYVYAVLYDPIYRETYALNLKREFPRIPFYPDFWRWAEWGEALMKLHLGYETVEPWPLRRLDTPDEKSRKAGLAPKLLLKADKEAGLIQVDSETQLGGIPPTAWTYRLGNRSAPEWVLDQYKERKPKDPTIRERFDTYRFADHKEEVIGLLGRVARVSVDTAAIVEQMRAANRK